MDDINTSPSRLPRLTLLLSLALAAYHTANLLEPRGFAPWDGWQSSRLRARWGEFTLLDVELPTRKAESQESPFDAGGRWVRDLGYVLQYRTGRLPEFVVKGPADPYRRLYTREEIRFQYPAAAAEAREGFGRAVREWIASLEKRGVTVVIVPVPTKIGLERNALPSPLPPELPWRQGRTPRAMRTGPEVADEVYRQYVDSAPGHVVDLLAAFREHQVTDPAARFFVPYGTHWSSLGIAITARAVIRNLKGRGWDLDEPELLYENKLVPNPDVDLARSLQLPEWYVQRREEFRWFEPVYRLGPAAKGQSQGKLYVAGSCYSRRMMDEHGLGALLGESLGRLYADSSLDFAPATESLAELRRLGYLLLPGDLLVWEFPVRAPVRPGEALPLPEVGEPDPRGLASP